METAASSLISNFNDIVSGWPFWTGLGSVMLFSLSRFNVTLPDIDELSPPLRPRSFTTAFRFWLAAFVYIGCYASLYLALLAVGSVPQLREGLSQLLHTPVAPTIGTPAWAALVATAVLPALPWISSIDGWIRVRLQDFASIPSKARMVAREVLAALDEAEPAPINNRSTLRQIAAAISAHRARFDQLWRVWPRLQESDDAIASRRFSGFFRENQKTMDGFLQEFSSGLPHPKFLDAVSARYIEQKYRSGVKKVARFMVCSMLDAESTEFRVRGHWRSLGFKVEPGGLDFQLKNIITSLFGISIAVIISCYLSVTLYYLIHTITGYYDVGAPLSKILSDNTYLFLRWSVVTVLIYIPPITVAAGTAMYLLDQTSSGANLTFTDYATAAVLTFTASAILCFFVLLAYGVLYPTLIGETPQGINRLAPWTIPAALVATTFMLLSSCPRNANAELSECHLYVVSLSGVAMLGGLIAHFLSGPPPQDRIGSLPAGSFIYLVVIAPACIGACLGWLLSGTRHPRVVGRVRSRTAPGLRRPNRQRLHRHLAHAQS